jgi:hypothetical protein
MSLNRERPHLLVLPEDRANAQLANGFLLESSVDARRIQVLNEAGGWPEVLKQFESTYVEYLQKYPAGFMVLLLDFDGVQNRLEQAREVIPEKLRGRAFVLGAWNNPEKLKKAMGMSLERIGTTLAEDCQDQGWGHWGHDLLKHNSAEFEPLKKCVSAFLFQ